MSKLTINANSIYDRVIRIGRQTENLVSEITFNLNMWIEEYGAGECVLNVRRNGDGSAYPVPMTIADGMTTWTITDTDTARKGRGEIQLVYRAGDKVKTSPIFTISCGESLVGGEVPEHYEEWLTELNRMTAQVESAKTSASASAQTAQTAAQTATEKATEAEQSSTTASGFANNASASATSASASAQAAAQSAEQAASSVSDVEASAQAASQSAHSAEAAKTAAQTAQGLAESARDLAHGYASDAQGYADDAQASAQAASASATSASTSATSAQSSATSASQSATQASTSATNASASASQAQEYAEQAEESAAALSDINGRLDTQEGNVNKLKADLSDISDVMAYRITEDIYGSLTFTPGYMGTSGIISSSSTLQYSNKISVKTGDVLSSTKPAFRFVTAFSGDSAIADSGAENVPTYTVPEGIDSIVVTTYTSATNVKIYRTHDALVDINSMKDDVDALKTDVQEDLSWLYGYYNNTTLQYWHQTAQSIVYFKCKPNVEYTINKNIETPVFQICYIKEEPQTGVTQPIYNYTTPTGNTDITYTTGDGALYVLMLFGNYTGDKEALKSGISVTSKQVSPEDDEARTIITYDETYLPKHIYMIVNKDYEIYHSQICPKAENYTFKWNSGNNYGNRVRLKYDSIGDKTLKCIIYNADGTPAKQLFTTVHVVNVASGNIYLLPFGDSLTNHCVWESELMNMAENIVCVGSRSRPVKDSDGETRTVYDEGRAGFTSFNYTNGSQYVGGTDNGGDESPHNRWYDPTTEKFSAEYYFTNNFPSDQTVPNMMTIFLGMNDLLGTHTVDEIVANMKSIIDDILSYNSNMLIVLMTPQLRYMPSLNGHEHLLFLEYAEKMEKMATDYANIVFLPLPMGMDSVNNYNMKTVTINTRNTETEQTASDITHPAPAGYWQIADYVLGAISYIASAN